MIELAQLIGVVFVIAMCLLTGIKACIDFTMERLISAIGWALLFILILAILYTTAR